MRHSKILLSLLILSIALVTLILTRPKSNGLHPMVDRIHSLIQPFPETYQMCDLSDEIPKASRDAKYRLEVRIVSLPYCKGKCEVPPISGYLNDMQVFRMLEEVQGNIACSTLVWPKLDVSEGQTIHNIANYPITVSKQGEHLQMEFGWDDGYLYIQEFDLPLGETYVTSFGENTTRLLRDAQIPFLPSRFQPQSLYQMECLLLVRYQEIEPAAVK